MSSSEALIIVDLQCAFAVPPRIVAGIRRYMGRFKFRVFTRFENPPGSLFRRLLKIESCPPGSPDTALRIAPEKRDIVLTKRGYGLGPGHLRRLKRLGIKRATICGIDTDACVLGVMFSLFDAGIDCRAKPDLCWSSNGLQREGMKIIETQFPRPRRG
jgi:nicotinamidase-related amidase